MRSQKKKRSIISLKALEIAVNKFICRVIHNYFSDYDEGV